MDTTVVQLSSYRQQPQPMSKRTFEAGLKSITKMIEQGKITASEGYTQIQKLQNEYFFPEM